MEKGTMTLKETKYEINFDNDHAVGSSAGKRPFFWDGEKWVSLNEAQKSIDTILNDAAQKYVDNLYYESRG